MNAGKSTTLLQSAYNYEERGMSVMLFTPRIDDRAGVGMISSRIGLQRPAIVFQADCDLYQTVQQRDRQATVHCVLVDEAQFLQPAGFAADHDLRSIADPGSVLWNPYRFSRGTVPRQQIPAGLGRGADRIENGLPQWTQSHHEREARFPGSAGQTGCPGGHWAPLRGPEPSGVRSAVGISRRLQSLTQPRRSSDPRSTRRFEIDESAGRTIASVTPTKAVAFVLPGPWMDSGDTDGQ